MKFNYLNYLLGGNNFYKIIRYTFKKNSSNYE